MKITKKHFVFILLATFIIISVPYLYYTRLTIELIYSVRPIEERKLIEETYPVIFLKQHKKTHIPTTIYMNVTGICYFNTLIQILQSDDILVKYIMQSNYNINTQPVSFTIKNIFTKISMNKKVNLYDEVDFLSKKRSLSKIISQIGGFTIESYEKIMEMMYEENLEIDKINFFMRNKIRNKFSLKCRLCKTITAIDYLRNFIEIPFKTNIEIDLKDQKLVEQIKELKFHKCRKCRGSLDKKKIKVECILPETLVISRNDFSKFEYFLKKKIPRYPIPYDFKILEEKYNLCGITISFDDDNISHICGIFRRDDGWFLYNDDKTQKINLEKYIQTMSERYWCYINHLVFRQE